MPWQPTRRSQHAPSYYMILDMSQSTVTYRERLWALYTRERILSRVYNCELGRKALHILADIVLSLKHNLIRNFPVCFVSHILYLDLVELCIHTRIILKTGKCVHQFRIIIESIISETTQTCKIFLVLGKPKNTTHVHHTWCFCGNPYFK